MFFIPRPRSRCREYCHHRVWRAAVRPRFVSGGYLAKRLLDCFHIAHSHASGGVDVPFEGFDLCPNFLPSTLGRLLT